MRQVHVAIPEECQQQANEHELKLQLLVCDKDVDQTDEKQNREEQQENAGQN